MGAEEHPIVPQIALELHDQFHYHAPTASGVVRHQALAEAFEALAGLVMRLVPHGREQALARTNLEQAKMWASAGVARNPATR